MADDTVIQQTQYWYNAAREMVASANYERLPGDADTEGLLNAANSYATASVVWYDAAGRTVATADFGREDGIAGDETHYFFHGTSGTDIGGSFAGDLIDADQTAFPTLPKAIRPCRTRARRLRIRWPASTSNSR